MHFTTRVGNMGKRAIEALMQSRVWVWVVMGGCATALLLAVVVASGGVYRTVNTGGGDFYIVNRFNGRTWLVQGQQITRIWTPAEKRAREQARAEQRLANIERIETAARRVRAVAVADRARWLYHWPYRWNPKRISRQTPLPPWIDPMGLGTHKELIPLFAHIRIAPSHRHEPSTSHPLGHPTIFLDPTLRCEWPGVQTEPPDKCLAGLRRPVYFPTYLEALEGGHYPCPFCLPSAHLELLSDTAVLAKPRPRARVVVRLLAGDSVEVVADHAKFWAVDTETHGVGWVPMSVSGTLKGQEECHEWLRNALEMKRIAWSPQETPDTRREARGWLLDVLDGWVTDRDAALALRRHGLRPAQIAKTKGWSLRYVEGLLWGQDAEK